MPHSNRSAVVFHEEVFLHWWGRKGYNDSALEQEKLRDELLSSGGVGHLIFVEHPHVISSGRHHSVTKAEIAHWKAHGVDYSPSSRGGKLTYHGPGQLVLYPILNLRTLGLGVRDFVASLNDGIAEWLERLGIQTCWREDAPGLWTTGEPSQKLVSVGLRVTRGVTTHGAAINLSTDTNYFQLFEPCGFAGSRMSTVEKIASVVPSSEEAASELGPLLVQRWGKQPINGEKWPPTDEGSARAASVCVPNTKS